MNPGLHLESQCSANCFSLVQGRDGGGGRCWCLGAEMTSVSHPGPDTTPPRSTGRGGWKPSNPSLAWGLFFNFTRSPKARVIKFYVLPRILGCFLPTMAGDWDCVGYGAFLPVAVLFGWHSNDTIAVWKLILGLGDSSLCDTLAWQAWGPEFKPRTNIIKPGTFSQCQHWKGRARKIPGACWPASIQHTCSGLLRNPATRKENASWGNVNRGFCPTQSCGCSVPKKHRGLH